MKECMFYKKLRKNIIQCKLCPRLCVISKDNVGFCRTRKNIDGKLISLSYGLPVALHVDPITKKPLYHFLTGTNTFSIGTVGCNLQCNFCQNYEISQASSEEVPTSYVKPEEVVKRAIKNKCESISYTYTDPVAFYEYVYDISKLAKKKGLKNVLVTNGYINPKPLKKLCKFVDAVNVDLKSFNEEFYKNICFGSLKPVLVSLKILKKKKVWIEITNLIIPGYNDNFKYIEKMCKWIRKNLGKDVPLHFSRFFPMHKFKDVPVTPLKTMKKAEKIAKKYLENVYLGNV